MQDDSRVDPERPDRRAPHSPLGDSPTRREIRSGARGQPRERRHSDWEYLLAGVLVVVVATFVFILFCQSWTGIHQSPLAIAVLRTRIIGGPAPIVIDVLATVGILFVLARKPTRRRIVAAAIGVVAGILMATAALLYLAVTDLLGVVLSATSTVWIVAGFAGIGLAVAGLFTSRGWRLLGIAASLVLIIFAATLGVNADFGLDPNIGDLAGISTQKTITLPLATSTPTPIPTARDGGALWANWMPPAGMPTVGATRQVVIPAIVSGFHARPAGLYLPPAALVPNPPKLPLVIMMMGQPGNPDPSFQAAILNAFAASHDGLAPIVLVADQIGNPADDPLCTDDTKFGKAQTYITQDVVGWARTHLNVLQDAAHWTIAGYSNGGECAFALGAAFPGIWGNVLDISGEVYPGSDAYWATLADDFHGDRSAYEATWPQNILRGKTFPDTDAVFTVSTNDSIYLPQAKAAYKYATAAGWKSTFFEVLNGGHVLGALLGGLREGYSILYPRLGLSDPSTSS